MQLTFINFNPIILLDESLARKLQEECKAESSSRTSSSNTASIILLLLFFIKKTSVSVGK